VKKPKKTIAFPRRTWQINPSTRVVESAKKYSRAQVKRTEARSRPTEQ
jgi:hypothetical protein